MAALQDDLNAAHRAIDELRDAKPAAENGASLAEIQQLRGANTHLDAQVEELRRQLQASETKLQNAGAPDSAANERQTQLENSLIELKQQLEKSQARIRELESSATPMVDLSAIEAKAPRGDSKTPGKNRRIGKQLERQRRQAQHQIDSLQQRVRESEKLEQELRAALRRREEELPQWQERLATSDEIKNRLLALQPVYDQLVAKYNSLIEHQREYHGELKSFAQFLSASHDGTIAPPTYFDPQAGQEEAMPAQLLRSPMAAGNGSDIDTCAGSGKHRSSKRRCRDRTQGQARLRCLSRRDRLGRWRRANRAILEPERRSAGDTRSQAPAGNGAAERSCAHQAKSSAYHRNGNLSHTDQQRQQCVGGSERTGKTTQSPASGIGGRRHLRSHSRH